ncbi:MAG TPA: hypothetical protein VF167_08465 [Longimicrobiaceae bacterium]
MPEHPERATEDRDARLRELGYRLPTGKPVDLPRVEGRAPHRFGDRAALEAAAREIESITSPLFADEILAIMRRHGLRGPEATCPHLHVAVISDAARWCLDCNRYIGHTPTTKDR